MTVESTKEIVLRFLNSEHSDTSMMTKDVIFRVMGTGEAYHGPQAVLAMMDHLYNTAFKATAVKKVTLFGEKNAVLEAEFVGQHVGEFAGIQATGKDVRVPMCVVYDIEDGKIKQGRVYFEMPVLLEQLGAAR